MSAAGARRLAAVSELKCLPQVPGGWQLDGYKRWIGNGTWADVVIVWARSSETGQVGRHLMRSGWWSCGQLVSSSWAAREQLIGSS